MAEITRFKHARLNMISAFINKILNILFPFILRTIIIEFLGSNYLGLNSLFTSILQVLNLAELGISNAIVFSLYKPISEGNNSLICALYNFYKKSYRIIGIVVLILGICIAPFLTYFIKDEIPIDINIYVLYFIYLFNTVISYFLFAYKDCILIASQRNDISNNIVSVGRVLMYVIQLIFIIAFKNYYVYVIIIPIFTIVINIFRSFLVDRLYPEYKCFGKLPKESLRELYKRITGLMLYKIGGVFRNSFDSIVISSFLGLVILSKYDNYYYILNAVIGIISVITTSIISIIGNCVVKESIEKNYENFNILYFLFNWLSTFCAACFLCLFQPFIELWLGQEYLLGFDIVILFSIYFYVLNISEISYSYRQAVGLWWEDKFRPIVESILNLVLNVLVVKFFGVAGVLVSTIVTISIINIPWGNYILFKNYFRKKNTIYILKITINFFITSVICFFTFLLCELVSLDNLLLTLIIRFIICFVFTNATFILINLKNNYLKKSLLFMKKIIIKK